VFFFFFFRLHDFNYPHIVCLFLLVNHHSLFHPPAGIYRRTA
jgi:hypothetical protein